MSDSKLTGPWETVPDALREVNNAVRAGLKKATARNLRTLEATLVKHIQNQDLGWASLNPIYKKWKERNKLSNQIWIATSTTINSITTQLTDGDVGGFVGVLRQTRAAKKRGGKAKVASLASIAAIHEFGIGVPKRPLFAPTLEEKGQEMQDNYINAVLKALNSLAVA